MHRRGKQMKLKTVMDALLSIKEDIDKMNLGSAKRQLYVLRDSINRNGIEVTQNVMPEYPLYGDCGGVDEEKWEDFITEE